MSHSIHSTQSKNKKKQATSSKNSVSQSSSTNTPKSLWNPQNPKHSMKELLTQRIIEQLKTVKLERMHTNEPNKANKQQSIDKPRTTKYV